MSYLNLGQDLNVIAMKGREEMGGELGVLSHIPKIATYPPEPREIRL